MRKALEHEMIERWPTWFSTGGDIHHTLMPFGFMHDDGWFHIRLRLCEDLEPLLAQLEQATECEFEILQVKGEVRWVAHLRESCRRCHSAATRSRPTGVFPYMRGLRSAGKTAGTLSN
jgi:hypothetical protein